MPPSTPDFRLPNSDDVDLSGRSLGNFHLLRRLGHGAMADVYLAEQERLKRRVAVKVLKPALAADRSYLQRFQIEAQAAASLVHANIVQIYEVGCVDGLHYIAQEYVQGMDLRDYLDRHGPLDLPHALSIMRQVAAALTKAAEQGVIHRDIKPENIMLTAGGEVKVADFGLARLTREATAHDLTQVGITLGTPLYMSPEQVEGKSLDPRSDIYSFGVTCYQMLTGSPPFTGETVLAVAVQHLKKQPAPLDSLRPDLPPAMCRIVHQMLAKAPSQRFATARDLLRELRRVQVESLGNDWPDDLPAWESASAPTSSDPRAALTQQLEGLMKTLASTRRRHRNRAWLVLGLLGAFVIGGAAAWLAIVPTSLLADAKTTPSAIPRQTTVLRQWYLASQLCTEAGWQSVLKYFPEKKDFALHAKQQLALIYLQKYELDRAMAIFEEMAKLGSDQAEFKAFGLAGKCVVLSIRRQYDVSNNLVAQIYPIRQHLKSRPMSELLDQAIKMNRSKLNQPTTPEWDKWFQESALNH